MEQAVAMLATAVVPGAGPVLATLSLVRRLFTGMQESKAFCESLQSRLDATWARLLQLEKDGALPRKFKVADFTDILARFHALVLKQAEKSFVVRVGTSVSFMQNLQACHDDLDQLNEMFRDQAADSLLKWRVQWERDVVEMTKQVSKLAAAGVAARMTSDNLAESNEAIATLVHEQQKVLDHGQILEALKAICFQLSQERNLTLPTSMPPWFFTFDDVDVEREPLHRSAAALPSPSMGTVHRAKWGTHTNVIVKKIFLPEQPTPSSSHITWHEADVWWGLNHPNVLRMYGACHVTKPAFIVCEEAKHGNIREYLAADQRHGQRFWRLQLDVAVGLAHLKANRVIHGNLKVNNILVGDDGRAKITDFGFSYIRDSDSFVENDTMMTDGSDVAAVAPYAASWPAPELRAAAERGDRMVPSYETDVYAFAVCMMQLLSGDESHGNQPVLARLTLTPKRPQCISDDAWDLIKRMCSQEPTMRPTIHQVLSRLQRLADEEAGVEEVYSVSSAASEASSHDVDSRRAEYQQQRSARGGALPRSVAIPNQQEPLQRELEDLRRKIREEERALEHLLEKTQREERTKAQPPGEASKTLPSSLSTKQLLRILRWGTVDEQSQALLAIEADRVDHSALEIVRNNGLDIIVAIVKHGYSSEFRQTAMDILQSIATAGTGLYLDAVLEHGVTQILMGILHYRRVAAEQRRAGQLLVLLATRSARARSFFLQNAGLELLIKLLWQQQIPMFDRGFKERTEPSVVEEMRSFLATQAESRTRDGDRAASQRGNFDLALQKYTEAIVLDPRNGRLYAKRSAVYAAFRKYDHAAKDAEQCIRFLPNYGEGYFRHAVALYQLNRIEPADRAVQRGRKFDAQFFTEERLYELAVHAPRDRFKGNPQAWIPAASVEL